ncbi:hypothetical protein RND81_02G230200 [Saponaria officinalis]|uniref:Uncharacterized protein n=1 Tax=Saponaria officinalis TaxID=3572 RepID=A0AAW1MWT1_SAPOF
MFLIHILIMCRFRWKQQFRREYPDEFYKKYESRGKGDYQIDYQPAPRISEADESNGKRYSMFCLSPSRVLCSFFHSVSKLCILLTGHLYPLSSYDGFWGNFCFFGMSGRGGFLLLIILRWLLGEFNSWICV